MADLVTLWLLGWVILGPFSYQAELLFSSLYLGAGVPGTRVTFYYGLL